jgi:hypothetical protein
MTASSLHPKPSAPAASSRVASVLWVEVMVEFAPSPGLAEEQLSRGERYRQRCAEAQRHRQELEAWLDREGLRSEVKDIGEATAFDLLFARATPQAAAAMQHAPEVVAVTPAGDLSH